MKCLPRWSRRCVQLKRVEVWIVCDMVTGAGHLCAVRYAVSQGFAMVRDAYECALDACKAEALIFEFASFPRVDWVGIFPLRSL